MGLTFSYCRRTAWIALLTFPFLIAFPIAALLRQRWAARLLRVYLQSCGGGFVKIGQLLSMRYDLLSPAYLSELSLLLDAMPAVGFERIRAIVEEDLGKPLEALFASFETAPLGSASIAQVHGAVLRSGERVVVKVIRPGVRRQFEVDLLNLAALAQSIDFLGVLSPIDLSSLAREVSSIVRRELDFRREARNAHRLGELMRADAIAHRSPRVYFDRCAARVITMERLEGVCVKDVLAALVAKDTVRLAEYRAKGVEPENVGRLLFRSISEQCYRHRVFHADPHAANLIVDERGWLGYIDFGQVGVLDEKMWAQQYRIFDMLTSGRVHAAYEALLTTLEPIDRSNLGDFESDVKELFGDWLLTMGNPFSDGAEKSAARLLLSLGMAMRRAGLRMRWNVLRLYRVQIVSDMVVYTLAPRLNATAEMRAFFCDERERRRAELFGEDFDLVGPAAAAWQAVDEVLRWMRFTLPNIGRRFADEASHLELGLAEAAHYARLLAGGVAFCATAAKVLFAVGSLAAFRATPIGGVLDRWGWTLAVVFGAVGFVITRVRRRLVIAP